MHPCILPSRFNRARRVFPWLFVLLFNLSPDAKACAYLRLVGPPPLREAEPAPIPVEIPSPTPVAAEIATHEDEGPQVDATHATETTSIATSAPENTPDTPVVAAPPAQTPPPVLQDPLRERVRLEDLLPFFTPPGQATGSSSQPLSSATYRRE